MEVDGEVLRDFGWALRRLRAGKRVRRAAWTAGWYLFVSEASEVRVWYPTLERDEEWHPFDELLATDWCEVDGSPPARELAWLAVDELARLRQCEAEHAELVKLERHARDYRAVTLAREGEVDVLLKLDALRQLELKRRGTR